MTVENPVECPIGRGNLNGYNNHKCRCELCRAAHAAYQVDYYRRHPEQLKKHRVRQMKTRRARGARPNAEQSYQPWQLARVAEIIADGGKGKHVAAALAVPIYTAYRMINRVNR